MTTATTTSVRTMNNLKASSAATEAVAMTLRHPPKAPPPPSHGTSTTTTSLTPSGRPKLKVLTSNQLSTSAESESDVVRKLSRTSSSPGTWLQGVGESVASTAKSSLFGSDSAPILPNRAPDGSKNNTSPAIFATNPVRRARSHVYRAAEVGKQSVLPLTSSTAPKSPLRIRARSSNSFASRPFASFSGSISTDQVIRSSSKSLRSRRRTNSSRIERVGTTNDAASHLSDDHGVDFPMYEHDEEPNTHKPPVYADDKVDGDGEESLGANKKFAKPNGSRDFYSKLPHHDNSWFNMKSPQSITLILLLIITCFVAGSYRQVLAATSQIEQVRLGESTLLVHLHKVEQQALQLAENLKHISDRNDGTLPLTEEDRNTEKLDSDLLRVQVEKLRDMEAELDHEVQSLRKKIQQSARQEMVKTYGQGAVQVFLEIESEGDSSAYNGRNTLSIRLWFDTPHTVWTFLQQIRNGVWNGAALSIQHGRALVAEPRAGDSGRHPLRPALDFVEPSERGHERYTVTLTDTNFAINLQDNKKIFKHEACVGVVFEGFDVLHKVVKDSARSSTVKIKKVRASHMTRAESAGLI